MITRTVFTAGRRLAAPAAIAVLALFPALAMATATLSAPSSAKVGGHVSVSAKGLEPGRYSLVLVKVASAPKGVSPTACSARVGTAVVARSGAVTIAGTLPTRLACSQAAGPVEGHITAKPGKYLLDVGVLTGRVFGKGSLVIKKITLT